MDVTLLKVLLLLIMGVVPVVFGLLPIKVLSWLARKEGSRRLSSLLLSMLSCFAGGVILGVCLIELLPEAREGMNEAIQADYPLTELLVAVGFFIVYFVEEFIGAVCGHEHDHDTQSTKSSDSCDPEKNSNISVISCTTTASDAPIAPPSTCDSESVIAETIVEEKQTPKAHRKAVVEAVTFILALIIHTSLEGFAFGVQEQVAGVASLFFGIVVHKALVSFSVGMTLVRALPKNLKMVVGLIFLFACFTPIGGFIGLALQSAEIPAKNGVSAVLTCISIGTFIFIAFFEILAPERLNDHSNLLQWVACAGGFAVMAVALYFGHGHGHSDSDGHVHQ